MNRQTVISFQQKFTDHILNGDRSARCTLIKPADERKAASRFEVIEPILFYERNIALAASLRLKDGRSVTSLDLLYAHQAEIASVSTRTLHRWVQAFQKRGIVGLRRNRSGQSKSRWLERNPEAKVVALAAWLEPGRTYISAFKSVDDYCRSRGIAAPSCKTIQRFLKRVPVPIAVFAREGERLWRKRRHGSPYVDEFRAATALTIEALRQAGRVIAEKGPE